MEYYEMGPWRRFLYPVLNKAIYHFGLKFCVGGSKIQNLDGEAKALIFWLCVSVMSRSNYHNWMGFIQTYQKAQGRSPHSDAKTDLSGVSTSASNFVQQSRQHG
jgi:hypothetical protein